MTRAPGPFSYATSQNPQDSHLIISQPRLSDSVRLCRIAFPLDRPSGNRLPGIVVDSLGGVTLWPDLREPIANAKLDAELFADVGAIIVMLMLVHGRWYVQ